MALTAYLKLKGQKQGDIKGSVTQKGREGKIAVVAARHGVMSPRDAASGLPTGRRQHRAFMLTKELDAASPLLYALLINNENIPEWELQCWAPQLKAGAGAGSEVQHYTVRLTNARLADIQFVMADNRDPALAKLAASEELYFAYSKIEWTWTAGGISTSDIWEAGATLSSPALPAAATAATAKPALRKTAAKKT